MLNKCANPDCGETFRYLQEGRLFRVERERERESLYSAPSQPEYFWLCSNCCEKISLRLGTEERVTAVEAPDPISVTAGRSHFVLLDRKEGLLLSYFRICRLRAKTAQPIRAKAACA